MIFSFVIYSIIFNFIKNMLRLLWNIFSLVASFDSLHLIKIAFHGSVGLHRKLRERLEMKQEAARP